MAGQDLSQKGPKTHVAEVVHHGDKLIIPEKMTLLAAIELIQRRIKYLTETVTMQETFPAFPWDGAAALDRALSAKFGWTTQEATPGFFGDTPPKLISIEVGPGKRRKVPWGRFSMPGVTGFLQTGLEQVGNLYYFQLIAQVTRGDEATIQDIFDRVRTELTERSIYRGKAFRIKFLKEDDEVDPMPQPAFIDTDSIDPDMLVYSETVQSAIETNLFTPITRAQDCLDNKIPLKRGILLGGKYGTGKTLAANVAAKLAVEHGITYLYIPNTDELPRAIEFARLYQSPACVVFCEDIDRTTTGERSTEMDRVLNTIDGIDSKGSNIIVVLTTNHLEDINPAMMRPGRLDAVIEVTPPDAEAVIKLIQKYGKGSLDKNIDLSAVGKVLDGEIPAVIAEVVKRAKLSQLRFTPPGEKVTKVSGAAILDAAQTMKMHLKLLNRTKEEPPVTIDKMVAHIVRTGGELPRSNKELVN